MKVVDYSDSDSEESREDDAKQAALPALPTSFLDLYSSTVRTSTKDDPALHSGRKRINPHVEGNWPTHVYLEWLPSVDHIGLLKQIVAAHALHSAVTERRSESVHSLLQNDLGVVLPLHVSLSRPLVLRTEQKSAFQLQLETRIKSRSIRSFTVHPRGVQWHANEDRSRHFLVLGLSRPADDQLGTLLALCNDLADKHGLPQLYNASRDGQLSGQDQGELQTNDSFHISIAWSLQVSSEHEQSSSASSSKYTQLSASFLQELSSISIDFTSVKIRIGQDISAMPFAPR